MLTGAQVLSMRELVREIPIASHVRDLDSLIVLGTHPQWERAPEIARRYVRYGASPRGAQALVLGCTEIPLVLHAGAPTPPPVPVVDATEALARQAVAWSLARRPPPA